MTIAVAELAFTQLTVLDTLVLVLGESEVIEEAIRRDLGLDLMERLWSRNDMSEEEAMTLALEAQQDARRRTHL